MNASPLKPQPTTRDSAAHEIAAALQCEKRNRAAEALVHYRRALGLSRLDPSALPAIIRHLSRASRQRGRDPALRHLLGTAYLFGMHLGNAEIHLRKAAALAPAAGPILCTLGDCLVQAGKPDEALASYRKAAGLAPRDRDARIRLAGLLAYRGEKAESRSLYQSLIDEGVRDPLVYAGLMEVSDYSDTTEPPEYSAAIALADNATLPPALRRMLHFSAAKIDRARARRDLEFAHYVRAKEYFPYRFDLEYFSDLATALKEAVTPEFCAERSTCSDNSRRPVFIVGMPRSGTTLTEQILAAHPSIAAAGELTFFSDAARQIGIAPRQTEKSLPLERIAQRLSSFDPTHARALAAKYREELQRRGGGRMRVTDKMPGNFLHVWLIALLFGEAAYIHCTRDPLATCFSCFTTDLGDAHAYTRDLATLAGYYKIYASLMRHWNRVLPIAIFESRYEELVRQPEVSVRSLLAAVKLPWDPVCLSFHESPRLARTASYAAVREPIHARNLEKWRAYQAYLGPLEAALGSGESEEGRGRS